jgi:hypothetical protein
MDPITAAIIGAITAGVASGLPKVAETAISDAYAALKARLKSKAGEQSDVIQAVEKLEADPGSAGWKGVLQEQLATARLTDDPEVVAAAEELRRRIEAGPGGPEHMRSVTASGERSIAIGGDVNRSRLSTGNEGKPTP